MDAEETGLVDTVNVAVVRPAATVTLAGTVATAVLLLDNATTAPPAGAAEVSVTVACDGFPPTRLAGLRATDEIAAAGGFTVSKALPVTPPYEPKMYTPVEVATVFVAMENVALLAPAATVTSVFTLAAELLLDNVTIAPPDGAALDNVTEPTDELPLVTMAGLTEIDERPVNGSADSVAVATDCPRAAVVVTAVGVVTAPTNVLNDAVVEPCGMVTVGGTVNAELLLDRPTVTPPEGAIALIVTVPTTFPLPTMLLGFSVSDVIERPLLLTVTLSNSALFRVRLLRLVTARPTYRSLAIATFVPLANCHCTPSFDRYTLNLFPVRSSEIQLGAEALETASLELGFPNFVRV